jgi:DNA-binding NarL/FixJ family response regulator
VLLVDDHPAVLTQVKQLLPADFEVVAALPNGSGLAAAIEKHRPEILLLDITLPGASGIELAAQLRRTGYSGKLVFLTVHDDPDYVGAALVAGADGYVLKSRLATDLIPALQAVLAGRQFVSPGSKPPSPS